MHPVTGREGKNVLPDDLDTPVTLLPSVPFVFFVANLTVVFFRTEAKTGHRDADYRPLAPFPPRSRVHRRLP